MAPAHEMQAPPSSGGDALSYLAVALGGALVIAAAGMWLLLRGKASQAGKR